MERIVTAWLVVLWAVLCVCRACDKRTVEACIVRFDNEFITLLTQIVDDEISQKKFYQEKCRMVERYYVCITPPLIGCDDEYVKGATDWGKHMKCGIDGQGTTHMTGTIYTGLGITKMADSSTGETAVSSYYSTSDEYSRSTTGYYTYSTGYYGTTTTYPDNFGGDSVTTTESDGDATVAVSLHRLMLRTYPVYSIFIIVVILLGIVGNTTSFSLIVYRGLARKYPLYFCLACIAFLDLLFNLTAGLLEYVVPTLASDEFMSHLSCSELWWVTCTIEIGDKICGSTRFLSSGAAIASVWINVTVHSTKLVGQLSPFGILSRNIKPITTVCCVIALVYGFGVFGPIIIPAGTISANIVPKNLFNASTEDTGWYSIHKCSVMMYFKALGIDALAYVNLVNLITYSAIPGAALIILSLTIVGVFMKNYREHKRLMSSEINASTRKTQKDNFEQAKNRVLMLLPLSFVHIICTIPQLVAVIVKRWQIDDALKNEGIQSKTASELINRYVIIEFFLEHLRDVNHSVTFFIQLAISKTFRADLFGE